MSKVVFVGNVPYNMGEEQLIDVFRSVGQVIGFRLVFDRDTGKPKGYGFCEFADHETALSAVRNLNSIEVGGRPLRIDLADSDPFLEGKTTVRGELLDGGFPGPSEPRSGWRGGGRPEVDAFMANLPHGKPAPKGMSVLDAISQTLAAIPPNQLLEVLAQMKAFIITHPEQARTLLVKQPQLAYALFQALLLNNILPSEVLLKMHGASTSGPSMSNQDSKRLLSGPPVSQTPPLVRPPMPVPPPHLQHGSHFPPLHGMPPFPPSQGNPGMMPSMPAPSPGAMYPPAGMPTMPSYYRPTPPQPSAAPSSQHPTSGSSSEISDSQREMIMQVLNMNTETINALPESQRSVIMQLRNQFMNGLGP